MSISYILFLHQEKSSRLIKIVDYVKKNASVINLLFVKKGEPKIILTFRGPNFYNFKDRTESIYKIFLRKILIHVLMNLDLNNENLKKNNTIFDLLEVYVNE
ncbi:hypothetical protein BpHYR1_023203 [Brachionus plicatilis]|uniref:Uncharacterized protein n=1 Tax=Brachionus plicatilis TaxID=10195 RepID=A0A3M7PUW3_BRAPC|nr:hypothetical protein BpHYR1_023203 [Brachionus plicatilis]